MATDVTINTIRQNLLMPIMDTSDEFLLPPRDTVILFHRLNNNDNNKNAIEVKGTDKMY